jgi:hypothetical protein
MVSKNVAEWIILYSCVCLLPSYSLFYIRKQRGCIILKFQPITDLYVVAPRNGLCSQLQELRIYRDGSCSSGSGSDISDSGSTSSSSKVSKVVVVVLVVVVVVIVK